MSTSSHTTFEMHASSSAQPVSPSMSGSTYDEEIRPQAGPLPSKRGEIGFQEGVHVQEIANRSVTDLPARHPEDRTPLSLSTEGTSTAGGPASAMPNSAAPMITVTPPTDSSSTRSGKSSILSFFKSKKVPTYRGIRSTTLTILAFQLAFLGGTIALWVVAARRLASSASQSSSSSSTDTSNGAASNTAFQGSSAIFIHVLFGIAVMVQLLFLERRTFTVRAERYMYLNPGAVLPSHRRLGSGPSQDTSMGFAPWNRPPLPTYAAALVDSGYGTGDVEDHLIAAPPPPEYGNTRGSTLILASFLTNGLRNSLRRTPSTTSQRSQTQQPPMTERAMEEGEGEDPRGRPLSYVSRDEEWEEFRDAERARVLEHTLSQLERPQPAALRAER